MTFMRYPIRSKDVQDATERHVWGKQEYIESVGSIIKVGGTDTEDAEAAVINTGVSFNLPEGTDAEVFLLAASSDTQMKMAILSLPFDKQRRWPESEGGIQHPTDPEFSLHFSDKLAHVTKNKFAVGEKGEFEINGEQGVFRVKKLIIDGELIVNTRIRTPQVLTGYEVPPKFSGNKQATLAGGESEGSEPAQGELDFDNAK